MCITCITRELRAARGHLMYPQQHIGLACPVDYSIFAWEWTRAPEEEFVLTQYLLTRTASWHGHRDPRGRTWGTRTNNRKTRRTLYCPSCSKRGDWKCRTGKWRTKETSVGGKCYRTGKCGTRKWRTIIWRTRTMCGCHWCRSICTH